MKLPPKIARKVLKSATEAIVVVDGAGQIVFLNEQAEKLFGYDARELLGSDIEVLMPAGVRHAHVAHRKHYHGTPHNRPLISGLSLKGLHKDGEAFDAEISLTPIETEQGLIISSTVRKLRTGSSSDAYFKNLLDSAPDAMIIINNNGEIEIVNSQTEEMFGYSRSELLGRPIEMLMPARFRGRHQDHRTEFLKDPHVRPMGTDMELAALRKDGSEFPVEISLSSVERPSGRLGCSVIRDVTERKLLEDELIEARRAAERANKANTAFLAAASHDLRQPVQALSLLTGALRRTVKEPLAQEMVESQQLSLDAMTNLLNSLLDISRLDAGVIEPEFEEFPIQRLLDRQYAEFARQASQKGLTYRHGDCELIVRSDPNLLGEIVQNLVANAIRYTESGKVDVSCETDGNRLRIDVRDTGIGIAEDQLDEIFQEFHQCKSPGANSEGFGLGLAIVRRLADLLAIRVTVTSQPGSGSCFSVYLPLVSARSDGIRDDEPAHDHTQRSGASGLIVLIEDDVKVAKAWGLLLEAEGYRVAMAASAPEAQALLAGLDRSPDLIISDFHLLDGSTGVDAIAAIREASGREIPAFIVSGDTSKVVDHARALENSVLMSKPVNTNLLLEMAHEAILSGLIQED
jgi:protein-histidine pros-kinase